MGLRKNTGVPRSAFDAGAAAPISRAWSAKLRPTQYTRRDLQANAKAKGLPWDTGKSFDHSAPVSELVPASQVGDYTARSITLEINGERRQHGELTDLIWNVEDILHELSKLYALKAGDLIFMGTPAGVAALSPGDAFRATLDGVATLEGRILPA